MPLAAYPFVVDNERMSIDKIKTFLTSQDDIDLAIVFGSVASGQADSDSDVDVAVKTGTSLDVDRKMRLIEGIAMATGRPVDLIDLRKVGEPLLGQILRHGQRVVGSHSEYAELALRHVYANEDFVPYLERMLEERRQTWIG